MTVPLLVMVDPGDREILFEEAVELAARWPNAVLKRAEGLGHLRILRDAGCVGEAVHFLGAGRPGDRR